MRDFTNERNHKRRASEHFSLHGTHSGIVKQHLNRVSIKYQDKML